MAEENKCIVPVGREMNILIISLLYLKQSVAISWEEACIMFENFRNEQMNVARVKTWASMIPLFILSDSSYTRFYPKNNNLTKN